MAQGDHGRTIIAGPYTAGVKGFVIPRLRRGIRSARVECLIAPGMTKWALATALLLASCGGTATPGRPASGATPSAPASPSASAKVAPDKISTAYTAITSDQLYSMIAKEKGFFAENGLDVDLTMIGSGSNPQAGVIAGQLQVYQGAGEVVTADLAGADLAFIGSPSTAFTFYLFSLPSITTANELKGKRVAVTGLGASTHTAARLALRTLGLDPEKDVAITAVNNPGAIFAALQSGAVQAAAIGPSNIIAARQAGFHEMVDLAKQGVIYPAGWPIVSRRYADSHRDIIQRYVKSVLQGVAFQIKNPAESQAILGKYAKSDDAAYLKANYDTALPHLQKAPYPSLDGVKNVIEEAVLTNPAAKNADPNTFMDSSYVKSLDDSGFIASLYK